MTRLTSVRYALLAVALGAGLLAVSPAVAHASTTAPAVSAPSGPTPDGYTWAK
jgi:hypothetical protein